MSLKTQLYNLSIRLYGFALWLAMPVHPKAKKWIKGRRNWQQKLQQAITKAGENQQWIWFHAASLGEFEMGRNLIEAIRKKYPHYRILLSFFSPSGYEIRKGYSGADYVCYLPLDTPSNAKRFLEILQPKLAIFIRYELWLNYLGEMYRQNIPHILITTRVSEDSKFVKGLAASLYQKAFRDFEAIFTQDEETASILSAFSGPQNIISSSDTIYDRVYENFISKKEFPKIEKFIGTKLCWVCGSTWPVGERMVFEAFEALKKQHNLCLIIAPHEIKPQRIESLIAQDSERRVRYSDWDGRDADILFIDNIGMLSSLYQYADVSYIGGGFAKKSLHNILEAVSFGCPVVFGSGFHNRAEAETLLVSETCEVVRDAKEMNVILHKWLIDSELRGEIKIKNQDFVKERIGATEQIMNYCEGTGFLH